MKIVYSNHVYGEKVVVVLTDGKKLTVKADEEIDVTDEDAKGLLELEAFTKVGSKASKKTVEKEATEEDLKDATVTTEDAETVTVQDK